MKINKFPDNDKSPEFSIDSYDDGNINIFIYGKNWIFDGIKEQISNNILGKLKEIGDPFIYAQLINKTINELAFAIRCYFRSLVYEGRITKMGSK